MSDVLDIKELGLSKYPETNLLKAIPRVKGGLSYDEFFQNFLVTNTPCVVSDTTEDWNITKQWIQNDSINANYLCDRYGEASVPVSNCSTRVYNVQENECQKLQHYLSYWKEYEANGQPDTMPCFYLKDWHFVKNYPQDTLYRVPPYFASDWINEFYRGRPDLGDDYCFVYLGPKGSWTPLHVDVFTSFSWSANICGKKRWLLLPPGKEENLKDRLGTLRYDLQEEEVNELVRNGHAYEVIQNAGDSIFVPSGWHHQVWNMENTLSVNHNWVNACNIEQMWTSLKRNLECVQKEIADCNDMENWQDQCQVVLRESFGFDFFQFYTLLTDLATSRLNCLINNEPLKVFGDWKFGKNHIEYDLRKIMEMLTLFFDHPVVSELTWTNKSELHDVLQSLKKYFDL